MNRILHITAQAEPAELHGGEAGKDVYAVSLALEITAGAEDDGKAEAEAAVKAFLEALPKGSFHLYAVDKKKDIGEAKRFFEPIGPAPDVADWLADCKAGFKKLAGDKPVRFYVSNAETRADMRNATAVDLLRSAAKWPAPLAQNAGLLTALDVPPRDSANDPQVLIFLPEGTELKEPLKASAGLEIDLYDLTECPWLDGETITIRTSKLASFEPKVLGPRFERNGVFNTPKNPDSLQRLLQRIEEQAPTILWPATTLTAIASDPEFLRKIDQTPDAEPSYPAEIFNWVAQASVVSLFDIIIAGLLLPQSNTATEVTHRSLVLQRLSRFIAGKFEKENYTLYVDEEALYLNLHKALWTHLTEELTAKKLWTSILEKEFEGWLPKIQKALKGELPDERKSKEGWASELEELSTQLGELALFLESEAGAEGWLLRQFEQVFGEGGEKIDLTDTKIPNTPKPTDPINDAYEKFNKYIRGEYNAAEALRRDYGAEVVAAVLDRVPPVSMGTKKRIAEIKKALVSPEPPEESSDPFNRRFTMPAPEGRLLDKLLSTGIRARAENVPEALKKELEGFGERRIQELFRDTQDDSPTTTTFRPDLTPQPLYIPLADTVNPGQMEEIAANTSGLGLLIRAKGPDGTGIEPHVHLNLIKVTRRPNDQNPEKTLTSRTVDPTLPMFTGGTAGLFLPYTGAPLSSPNRTEPGSGGETPESADIQEARRKIVAYQKDEAEYDEEARTPALAYGCSYGISGFWLPLSGVLPRPLRANSDEPFDPIKTLPVGGTSGFEIPDTALFPYLRRTAVAEMRLTEETAATPTLGRVPKGVHPLALDDPRIALESFSGGQRWRDLFRLGDGTGALGQGDKSITLQNVEFAEAINLEELSVLLMTNPAKENKKLDSSSIKHDKVNSTLQFMLAERPSEPFWLRLAFSENATPQALSFSDPGNDYGQDSAARTAPVLLLAPNKTKAKWSSPSETVLKPPLSG